jgi:hypothetical protein
MEDGGIFIKYFAVLEKGRLDFYSREKVRLGGLCVYVKMCICMS